jgi:hypothetical protein
MKHAIPLTLAATAFLMFAGANAQTAPIAPGFQGATSNVIPVAERCGRGWHRGPRGRCIRNLSPRWPCYFVRGRFGHWRLICR